MGKLPAEAHVGQCLEGDGAEGLAHGDAGDRDSAVGDGDREAIQ